MRKACIATSPSSRLGMNSVPMREATMPLMTTRKTVASAVATRC